MDWNKICLTVSSIGVIINALIIPVYSGVAKLGNKNKEWLYKTIEIVGKIANLLITIGIIGMLYLMYK